MIILCVKTTTQLSKVAIFTAVDGKDESFNIEDVNEDLENDIAYVACSGGGAFKKQGIFSSGTNILSCSIYLLIVDMS